VDLSFVPGSAADSLKLVEARLFLMGLFLQQMEEVRVAPLLGFTILAKSMAVLQWKSQQGNQLSEEHLLEGLCWV